jgi:hypothetical protein
MTQTETKQKEAKPDLQGHGGSFDETDPPVLVRGPSFPALYRQGERKQCLSSRTVALDSCTRSLFRLQQYQYFATCRLELRRTTQTTKYQKKTVSRKRQQSPPGRASQYQALPFNNFVENPDSSGQHGHRRHSDGVAQGAHCCCDKTMFYFNFFAQLQVQAIT